MGARKGVGSSPSGGDTLHRLIQDVWVLKRCGLKEIVSYALIVVIGSPDTYEEVE